MDAFNIFTGATDVPPEDDAPPGYAARAVRVGKRIGATRLGMSVYELPGQAICPYHFEWTDEEWLIVWAGGGGVHYMLRRAGRLDYWDGEG